MSAAAWNAKTVNPLCHSDLAPNPGQCGGREKRNCEGLTASLRNYSLGSESSTARR